ncbi:Alpha/Beta hydrolase protein [Phyllosticta capitalensis]|uniref:Alpha/Beta hydrolase protein n=1 Tax=Phyllosticta capitalensis TaxID=121624 RepID=A0ABR1YV41_9PEZI
MRGIIAVLLGLRVAGVSCRSFGTPHHREFFYTSGQYISETSGDSISRGQVYVEHLIPAFNLTTEPEPLIFIHGGGQTGTNWLNKPDGNPGWSSYFLEKGYEVYIIDQAFRGRSPWTPVNSSDTLTAYGARYAASRYTAPEKFNLWPQAKLHTRWPGNGTKGDSIFDTYYKSLAPNAYLDDPATQQLAVQAGVAELIDQIGRPVTVVGHSQGGIMVWLAADARPNLVKRIVALEPSGPPFIDQVFSQEAARPYGLTDAPLTYDPPIQANTSAESQFRLVTTGSTDPSIGNCTLQDPQEPRQLANLKDIPTLVLQTQASYHAVYDWCTVEFLRQAGVSVDYLNLTHVGIYGNAHLFFLEENSDQIAGVVREWIEK